MRYGQYNQNISAYANLSPVCGGLAFESTYDAGLVSALKARIPASGRRWDATAKVWIVDPQYAKECVELADAYLGVHVDIPQSASHTGHAETRLLRIEYIGRCKDRGQGDCSAFGYCNGSWSVMFPETVLRQWFEAVPQAPNEQPTLYSVLAIKPTATVDEIRSAHRRLARQWHPDLCHEPDAAQQFKTIQSAYEILSDDLKRRKYDAGRMLEANAKEAHVMADNWTRVYTRLDADGFRSPLLCGWVLTTGRNTLGRFNVNGILQWEDITDSTGRIMVSSWPRGADTFRVEWR